MTALALTQSYDNAIPDDVMIGHYTQVVWAETAEVGCGFMITDTRRNVRIVFIRN